ncbi:MAG TPA: hypothetical protein PKV66_05520, partial [Candidatus Pelethenecus sp.]|nr:hypothetical protein [Candidatus Pelethenecus sp.]
RMRDFYEAISYLMQTEILNLTKSLSSYCLRRKVLDTYYRSFAHNIRGLLDDKSRKGDRSLIKYNKTLISYMNLEMITIDYKRIENFLKEPILASHQKIILAIGTVDLTEKIRVNEEIKNIYDLSKLQSNYIVIPSIGCTIDVFRTLIFKYPISILHIAGHGSPDRLKFVGSLVTPRAFVDSFAYANRLDWLCLNCCDSNSFINLISYNHWHNDISYIGKLNDLLAYNFSENLYTNFFLMTPGNIHLSFNSTLLSSLRYKNYIFQ